MPDGGTALSPETVMREIRSSAAQEIPTLKEHLKIAEQLGGKQGEDPLPQG